MKVNWFNYSKWHEDLLARYPEFTKFAEIGVHEGRSISHLSNLVSRRENVEIHGIDIWEDLDTSDQQLASVTMAECVQNIKSIGTPSIIKLHKKLSWDAPDLFETGYFDMVFIDADHSYEGCSKDIQAWLPKMKRGSVLAGHDCWSEEVMRAVQDNIKGAIKLYKQQGDVWEYLVD